ncbi:MAG: hypothetical protein [Microviridae sp.]|nr:MAG: hypothetical protein [Microviridae sp.]
MRQGPKFCHFGKGGWPMTIRKRDMNMQLALQHIRKSLNSSIAMALSSATDDEVASFLEANSDATRYPGLGPLAASAMPDRARTEKDWLREFPKGAR